MSMPNNAYGLTSWGSLFQDLECPSGQLCQVRQPGVQHLIAAGVIDGIDTITAMIDQKHIKRVSGKAKTDGIKNGTVMPDGSVVDGNSMLEDPEQLGRVFRLIDKVVCHMVVQPTILATPEDSQTRMTPDVVTSQGKVYADMVDLVDKMYIFQYAVGGGTDLEQFRKQFKQGVGGMASQ